jgi:acetylornithine deacetylase/succinyl-diaminopimelate desuccinylase-like protein
LVVLVVLAVLAVLVPDDGGFPLPLEFAAVADEEAGALAAAPPLAAQLGEATVEPKADRSRAVRIAEDGAKGIARMGRAFSIACPGPV